jgi:hypothetical protein
MPGLGHDSEFKAGNQFERKLCEQGGRTLIESHCKLCGKILLGTAIFGDLLEQEQQHAVKCGQPKGRRSGDLKIVS